MPGTIAGQMPQDRRRIATLGDINIDVVLTVDRLPSLGEEVFSSARSELLGGSAVNTAVVLARLGHKAAVMGAVGDDGPGDQAIGYLQTTGILTSLTMRSSALPTAMNTILVTPDGERTMIGARGANVDYQNVAGWESGLGWLHISGYALMEGSQQQSAIEAIETAQTLPIPCSIDVPSGVGDRIRDVVGNRLGRFAIVAGSRTSLGEITKSGQPIESLLGSGVSRVAMTAGPQPLLLSDGPERVTLTPPRIQPIDATGAGDALVAGLISASLAGLKLGPSAVLAAVVGAAATLVSGASQTLADSNIWPLLFEPDRWTDAHPDWLHEVADLVNADTTQQDER